MNGHFITFEGVEGCGKTTQIKMLRALLEKKGFEVVLTREPGGTSISDQIRATLLDAKNAGMDPIAELLLYEASRAQHIAELIRPALASGKIVLCDRYADATTAYQGAARNIPAATIDTLHGIATGGLWPELTILLDCAPEVGLSRANARNKSCAQSASEDRFEREAFDFHRRVRAGYLAIAEREPGRVAVIDAAQGVDEMHADIVAHVLDKLSR